MLSKARSNTYNTYKQTTRKTRTKKLFKNMANISWNVFTDKYKVVGGLQF